MMIYFAFTFSVVAFLFALSTFVRLRDLEDAYTGTELLVERLDKANLAIHAELARQKEVGRQHGARLDSLGDRIDAAHSVSGVAATCRMVADVLDPFVPECSDDDHDDDETVPDYAGE